MLKLFFIGFFIITALMVLYFDKIMMTVYWHWALNDKQRKELQKNNYEVLF